MQTIQRFFTSFSDTFKKQGTVGKIVLVSVALLALCCLCSVPVAILSPSNPSSETAATPADVSSIQTSAVNTAWAGANQTATADVPTNTPAPTNTPEPTNTPLPPTATPAPIVLTGNGDSIVDFDNPYEFAIVHITGNTSSRFFAVKNYGSDGNSIDLLVNTTDPYDGIRPLDFHNGEHTTRFEVNATGEWRIEVLAITSAHTMTVPGVFQGNGDDVILLTGATPDLAKITGNTGSRFFAVKSYGNSSDLLVNTTDPYEGTVIVSSDTVILEIQADGSWSIEITAK